CPAAVPKPRRRSRVPGSVRALADRSKAKGEPLSKSTVHRLLRYVAIVERFSLEGGGHSQRCALRIGEVNARLPADEQALAGKLLRWPEPEEADRWADFLLRIPSHRRRRPLGQGVSDDTVADI